MQERVSSLKSWLWIMLCGICMGAADIVPGISGGTIAFMMGIYEDLIAAVKSLSPRAFFSKQVPWHFLVPLSIGILASFATLAHFFVRLLNDEVSRIFLFSGFFGLVIAAALFCAKQVDTWQPKHCMALVVGILAAFMLTGYSRHVSSAFDVTLPEGLIELSSRPLQNYDADTRTLQGVSESTLIAMLAKGTISSKTSIYDHQGGRHLLVEELTAHTEHHVFHRWIVLCGALAVSAMLLPGISGSYILATLGMYGVMLGAFADFMQALRQWSFDIDSFVLLANFALGMCVGAFCFSRVISWLLAKYHAITIALLTGFMLGALRSVWPFWSYQYTLLPLKLDKGPQLQVVDPFIPPLSSPLLWGAIAFACVGMCLVFGLERLAKGKLP